MLIIPHDLRTGVRNIHAFLELDSFFVRSASKLDLRFR